MTGRPRQILAQAAAVNSLAVLLGKKKLGQDAFLEMVFPLVGDTPILVTGIVKRGKSTLVNQLLGAEVTPTRLLPETVGLIASRCHNGRRGSVSLSINGRTRRLPYPVWAFRRSVARSSILRSELALRVGRYKIAEGVTLVDTVGESEAGPGGSPLGSWVLPGSIVGAASGVIAVIGVPGYSASDIELLRRTLALRAFRENKSVRHLSTLVVIKALDSSVKVSDLHDIRRILAEDAVCGNAIRHAVISVDGDETALTEIRQWMSVIAERRQIVKPGGLRSAVVAVKSAASEALSRDVTIPDGLVEDLPHDFRSAASALSESSRSEERVKREQRRLREIQRKHEADYMDWRKHLDMLTRQANARFEAHRANTPKEDNVTEGGCMSGCITFIVAWVVVLASGLGSDPKNGPGAGMFVVACGLLAIPITRKINRSRWLKQDKARYPDDLQILLKEIERHRKAKPQKPKY